MPLETTSASARSPAQPGKKSISSRRRWLWLIVLGLVAVVVVAFAVELGWWSEFMAAMERADPVLTFVLMLVLPLAGFSIGVVYIVAGIKFGLIGGGVAVAAATAFHLVVSYWLGRSFMREPLIRALERRNRRIPEAPPGAERAVAAMAALVPGPPYFLRIYALAVSGIPLGKYLLICVAILTIRSYVTLALGDLSGDPSRSGVVWLVGIGAVKVLICLFLVRRITRKYRAAHPRGPAVAGGIS